MKKILLFLLMFPLTVHAFCSNQEISRYKSLSSNVDTYYDYNESENKFNITVYNLSNELRIQNKNDNSSYNTNERIGQINISNQNPGSTITLGIYPNNDNCKDYRIRTIYVYLPYYNPYYKDELCKNNNNILCSKWANTTGYTYEQFVEQVKETQKTIEEEQKPEEAARKYGFFDFLGDFYIPILLVIIVSGSIAIYFLDKKSKFDFSLK